MMKRSSIAVAALAIALTLAASMASAQTILFAFTGLPGAVDTCKWFDDNLGDRSIDALTRQTDLLYNRVALPAGASVAVVGTAATAQGEQLVDFNLNSKVVCTAAEAIYGPTPSPAASP
jgi:hypothetical protein